MFQNCEICTVMSMAFQMVIKRSIGTYKILYKNHSEQGDCFLSAVTKLHKLSPQQLNRIHRGRIHLPLVWAVVIHKPTSMYVINVIEGNETWHVRVFSLKSKLCFFLSYLVWKFKGFFQIHPVGKETMQFFFTF